MSNTLQIKRGIKLDLPTLNSGEFGFCVDSKELFVGDGATNYQVPTSGLIEGKGDLLVGGGPNTFVILSSGTNGQLLSYDLSTPTGLRWKDNSIAPNIVWSISSGTVCTTNSGYFVDSSNGPVVMYLPPNPAMGDPVFFNDFMNTSSTNFITIDRNGKRIEGLEENLLVDTPGVGFSLTYSNEDRGWELTYITGSEGPKGDTGDPGFTTLENDYNFIENINYLSPSTISGTFSLSTHTHSGVYIEAETDPVFSSSPAAAVTSSGILLWDEAYSWGNHSDIGYYNNSNFSPNIDYQTPLTSGVDYLTSDNIVNGYVPYSGAINNIDIGNYSISSANLNRNLYITYSDISLDETYYRVMASGIVSILLPTASGIVGREYNLINIGDDNVTISGTEYISGDEVLRLTSKWDSVSIVAANIDDSYQWIRCY